MQRILFSILSLVLVFLPMLQAQAPATDDEFAAFIDATDARLAAHPFLGKISKNLIKVTRHRPWVFYLKPPDGQDKEYEAKLVNSYLPFLTRLNRIFESNYTTGKGLTRRKEVPGYAIVVLHSKGDYLNYAQLLGDEALEWTRAHYDPRLQVAVTYEDTYAQDTADAMRTSREAILHEVVHAIQHAHGPAANLPPSPLLNEGIAEYRSKCTHVASSLDDPPTSLEHLSFTYHAVVSGRLKPVRCSLQEMVLAGSYGDVVKTVQKRTPQAARELILGLFYAQAEMFTRFLHEAEGGRYRDAYLQYFVASHRGMPPKDAFAAAFGKEGVVDFQAMEQAFSSWTDRVVRNDPNANSVMREGSEVAAAAAAGGLPGAPAPSTSFDLARLAWQPGDLDLRQQFAQLAAAQGDFAQAIARLPAGEMVPAERQPSLERWRSRFESLQQLQQDVIASFLDGKKVLPASVGTPGKLKERRGDRLVVEKATGKEIVEIPVSAFGPKVLIDQGRKLKKLDENFSAQRAMLVLLRWLEGATPQQLEKQLQGDHPLLADLRSDLAAPFARGAGLVAELLATVRQVGMPDAQPDAAAALARIEPMLVQHAGGLTEARRKDLREWVTALAERAFAPGAALLQMLPGCTLLPDGRIRSEQSFEPNQAFGGFEPAEMPWLDGKIPNIVYDGPARFGPGAKSYELVGRGILAFAVPLGGKQRFELDFTCGTERVDAAIYLAAHPTKGFVEVRFGGTLEIVDTVSGTHETMGDEAQLFQDKRYRLAVEYDAGKSIQVSVDGKQTLSIPKSNLGLDAGRILLVVHRSTPLAIHRILIEGMPAVDDPAALRARYVQQVLERTLGKG